MASLIHIPFPTLNLIKSAGAFGGEFRVFNLLDALVAHPCQPALERFGLGCAWDDSRKKAVLTQLWCVIPTTQAEVQVLAGTRQSKSAGF